MRILTYVFVTGLQFLTTWSMFRWPVPGHGRSLSVRQSKYLVVHLVVRGSPTQSLSSRRMFTATENELCGNRGSRTKYHYSRDSLGVVKPVALHITLRIVSQPARSRLVEASFSSTHTVHDRHEVGMPPCCLYFVVEADRSHDIVKLHYITLNYSEMFKKLQTLYNVHLMKLYPSNGNLRLHR